MPLYDIFFDNTHPAWAQKLLTRLNGNLLRFILRDFPEHDPISVLEIGPGKAYFYLATRQDPRVRYAACDRNGAFGRRFPDVEFSEAETPPLPHEQSGQRYDVIYAAYVIEHLNDGVHVSEFVNSCRRCLKPDGRLVLTCPNAMKQKFELWNMDYTHTYPTTKRNVAMLLQDAGFDTREVLDIHGLLTFPHFETLWFRWALGALLSLYSYRLCQTLLGWLASSPEHAIDNPFYRLYGLAKQPNLLFIATPRHTDKTELAFPTRTEGL